MTRTSPSPRTRPRARARRTLCAAVVAVALQTAVAPTFAGPQDNRDGRDDRACVRTEGPLGGEARRIRDIARKAKADLRLKSVELRVTVDGNEVLTDALGESMADVPAQPDMHFRAGSVAFSSIGTTLLQLVEEGRVGLDDTVERWLPRLPQADKITLRMLAGNTTSLHDYVTDPAFLAALEAHPFRQWTPKELVAYPLSHPFWYKPGTN
ncbi:hypothetical protein GCM10010353_22820 [Streptomyces chryseus]|nr:hypothetical protein GCM10010353_22820 [Streptomyces chryseus]